MKIENWFYGGSWRQCSWPSHIYHRSNLDVGSFVKENIAKAPNNASAWNYLRGVLDYTQTPYSTQLIFVQPYTTARDDGAVPEIVDLENPLPYKGAQLPCNGAVEFLADIYEAEGGDNLKKATEVRRGCCRPLASTDEIRSSGNLWRTTQTRCGKSRCSVASHYFSNVH